MERIAGTDASYSGDFAAACVVVVDYPSLREEVRAAATSRAVAPYVPGYFAFREIPVLLAAFRLLPELPDVVLVHGHGYAHPRRAGIATHLGAVLGVPTIGVAGSLLRGMEAVPPGNTRGAMSAVTMGGEVVGVLWRPGEGKRPVCISAGYRVTLPAAIDVVARCTRDHGLPEPLFLADLHARRFLGAVRRARGEGGEPATG
ncbi:MAG: endonuclease V [Methanolinea sp.]